MAITINQRNDITKLVVAMFNAAPGATYLSELVSFYEASGNSLPALASALANTTAFKAINPSFQLASEFATSFLTPLGLQGNQEAIDFITAKFNAGVNKGQIILEAGTALNNSTAPAFADAKAILNNKTIVADYFSVAKGVQQTDINQLKSVIANVTAASSSVDTAKTAVDNGAGAPTSSIFTLTTGTDNLTGTSGNDVFSAADTTLAAADQVNGGAGTDVLNFTYTGAGAAFPAATLTSVETLNLRNVGTGTLTLNASTIAGVTAVNSDRSTNVVTVTNLATGAAAGVTGDGTVVGGAFNAGYVDAATAAIVNISGGTTAGSGAITLSGLGLTSTTVNASGAANTTGALTLAATTTSLTVNAASNLTTGDVTNTGAAALTTVTVTGAGAVSFGATAQQATVTKIDASANTGGLTVALGSAATQTVTGGTGNDVITTGGVLTTGSVNAGTGTDTLIVGINVGHVNTASLAAKYTGFETLRVNGTLDASLISGITAIQLSGAANSITNLNATQAAAVSARADIGATTLTLATQTGTADVLNLTMGTGTGTAAAANAGVLTITGFETLNVTANAGASATAGANRTTTITGAIVDTSLTAINLKGTAVAFTDIATTKAVTIDGSALTGDGATTSLGLTVAGSATAGSTITGSAVADSFTIGAEGSTYNGGLGNDGFTTTAAILTADGTTDVVLAGGGGTDTLTLTGTLTLTDNQFTNVTGMERLATAATTSVSYTGFAAAAKTAFADGLTITSGTLADGQTYTVGTGLYDKAVTLTLVSSGDGATVADNIAITTGSAADTVTVTAASWTGGAGAVGLANVSTGAGNDTISFTHGTQAATVTGTASVTINGGAGADVITAAGVNHSAGLTTTFVIAAGDSLVSAYDSITGFDVGTGALFSSTLDFTSVALNAYAATAVSGNTAGELTVAVSAAGVVTFAGTKAAALTLAEKIAAVQNVVVTGAGDSAVFVNGTNTYVFNNNATADSVVELVGVTGTSLVTANATTAGAIFIA